MASTKVDYAQTGLDVLDLVGGESNVRSLAHCATRLRFKLKDESLANKEAIEKLDGVVTVMQAGGQYQVVIGDNVPTAYKSISDKTGLGESPTTANDEQTTGNIFNRFVDLISSLFLPMLWPLAGAGLFKAFLALAVYFGFNTESQEYTILSAGADALIYFLPAMVAMSAAKRFRANQYTAVALAGFLLYPSIIAFNTEQVDVSFFGIPVVMVSYVSSVIPMIVNVWIQGHMERFLAKVLPSTIKNFTVPLIVLAVLSVFTLITVGPITVAISQGISNGVQSIFNFSPWLAGAIMGGFWQVFVMFGVHWGLVPIMINDIATLGYSYMKAPTAAAVIAQGMAALAVFIRIRDKKLKQAALPAGISGVLAGVTEPAVYGVNLPLKKPFIFACISGAIGGAIISGGGTAGSVMGMPSLLSIAGYMEIGNFTTFLLGLGVAGGLSFVLTFLFGTGRNSNSIIGDNFNQKIENNEDTGIPAEGIRKDQKVVPANAIVTLPAEGSHTTDLVASADGESIALADIDDPVFSSGAMGQGIGIKPTNGNVYAPISGKVLTALDSGHAYGIRSETGVEVLVHVGVDTVQMKGEGFTMHVKKGDTVEAGQPLVTFDRQAVAEAGYQDTVITIITNSGNFSTIEPQVGKQLTAGELAVVVER